MSWGWLSPRGRVLSRAGIGVLSWVVGPGLVDEAVGDGLAWEMRLRSLPSRLGVYFVLGLCLFSGWPYGQVVRELTGGLEAALAAVGWRVPATTALTAVRRRIGEAPLESLFGRVCSALSPGRSPWSHVCGLLAVAWDGTTVDAQASAANVAAFGKPGAPRRGAGGDDGAAPAAARCPQLRLVTLVACGTRALLDAAFGPARGPGTGEQHLARQLLASLRAGMLLIADRGFYSYGLWTAAAATGAHLLWRAKADLHLPVLRELPDGSYLTRINDPRAARARRHKNGKRRRRGSPLPPETGPLPGITVRVIAFTLTVTADDGSTRTERYRLLTTLADHRACPAAELAAGYAWRWAIEMVFPQLAKGAVRPSGGGREHVADLDVAVGDDDPVDKQLGQLATLGEGGGRQAGADSLAEGLDPVGDGAEFQLLPGRGVQLALLGDQGGAAAVQVLALAV
jgi:Insertion element 4 transposase N-terminal/Transposase DDE domain